MVILCFSWRRKRIGRKRWRIPKPLRLKDDTWRYGSLGFGVKIFERKQGKETTEWKHYLNFKSTTFLASCGKEGNPCQSGWGSPAHLTRPEILSPHSLYICSRWVVEVVLSKYFYKITQAIINLLQTKVCCFSKTLRWLQEKCYVNTRLK